MTVQIWGNGCSGRLGEEEERTTGEEKLAAWYFVSRRGLAEHAKHL